jgi:L-amino acid N-acyltransferase YncA
MKVRSAHVGDAEAIQAIYNLEVTTSTVTFDLVPRTLAEQRAWLVERTGARAAVVAEEDGEVVGFGSLSPYRDRPAYTTTVEDSVYVRRDRQGAGVGGLLLGELVRVATASGFHVMMARVVSGHEASLALHRAHGFRVVGTEAEVGRKFNRWLDVIVLQRILGDGPRVG